jgi:hypothetical protein
MNTEKHTKTHNKYEDAKIYSIMSPNSGKVYIGSTCQKTLANRMSGHRASFKRWKKGKNGYTSSYEIFECGDAYIELIENCPCNSKDEMRKIEGHHIRNTETAVNKNVAGRIYDKAYRRAYMNERNRKKRKNLGIVRRVKKVENVKTECECGGRYTHHNAKQHMETQKHMRFLKYKYTFSNL